MYYAHFWFYFHIGKKWKLYGLDVKIWRTKARAPCLFSNYLCSRLYIMVNILLKINFQNFKAMLLLFYIYIVPIYCLLVLRKYFIYSSYFYLPYSFLYNKKKPQDQLFLSLILTAFEIVYLLHHQSAYPIVLNSSKNCVINKAVWVKLTD